MDANGELVEKAYYLPWGGERGSTSITSTDYGYTGQMKEGDIYYYGARYYDPSIGRFMQADTIVPLQVQGTQAFDRYAYVNNNPLRYTDPSGHHICSVLGEYCETKDLKNEYRNKILSDHPHRPNIDKMTEKLYTLLKYASENPDDYSNNFHRYGEYTRTIFINFGLQTFWKPAVDPNRFSYNFYDSEKNGSNPFIEAFDFIQYAKMQPDVEVSSYKSQSELDLNYFRYGDIFGLIQEGFGRVNHLVFVTRVDLTSKEAYVIEMLNPPTVNDRPFWETNTPIERIIRVRIEDPDTYYWGGR